MIHAWGCSDTFSSCSSGILEQHVSGTKDRTRWVCSFPWFKSLRFLSLGCPKSNVMLQKPEKCRTCNNKQNGFEIIGTTPGTFLQARQSLFGGATCCDEARGGHFWTFSLSVRRRNSETRLQKAYFHIFFVLCVDHHLCPLTCIFRSPCTCGGVCYMYINK